MSRSGYSDDLDQRDIAMWRGQVASAIRGKRGQAFLNDMLSALDAMPEKRLITNELVREGEVCALGSVAVAKGLDVSDIDPYDFDYEDIASRFGIAHQLVQEIMYENDECSGGHCDEVVINGQPRRQWRDDTPEERWQRMRAWTASRIVSLSVNKEAR